MDIYLNGNALTLTIDLTDENGNAIADATAVSYGVTDQAGAVKIAETALPDYVANSPAVAIPVDAVSNTLAGALREVRVVSLWITRASGTHYQRLIYALDPVEPLVFLSNSFIPEAQADLIASELIELDAYWGAPRQDRLAALKVAYEHVCKPTYTISHTWLEDVYGFDYDWQRYDWWDYYSPWWYWKYRDWIIPTLGRFDQAHWDLLPVEFQQAVQKAQVAEANYLLRGQSIERKRNDGLMSESIGESSNMYRPGKPVMLAVCRDALSHLRPFVKFQTRISR